MKPLQHALIAAYRYGGQWQDWYKLHDWFDQSKKVFPSMQHRMFLHSEWGCGLAERVFGPTLGPPGCEVATAQATLDHQIEDLGRVVPLAEWLSHLDERSLVQAHTRALRQRSRDEEEFAADPVGTLARRYGEDVALFEPIIAFFDEPTRFLGDDPRGRWILHNSFGIYLAEDLFGPVLTLANERLLSVRGVGEELVKARLGFIPSAAAVASRVQMCAWMVGTEVGDGLRERGVGGRGSGDGGRLV